MMIPHGIFRRHWQDEFSLPANYAVRQTNRPYWGNYTLHLQSNSNNQQLSAFSQDCLRSCDDEIRKCYIIYRMPSELGDTLQICQDDLINLSVNKSLPLDFIYVVSGNQVFIDGRGRTRNESTWTFTRVDPTFTITNLVMHPFQMTIANANNTEVIAYINQHRPTYPYDNFAYEFMVMNHTRYSAYELGWLLSISLIVDGLRTYPKMADEDY